MVKINKCFFKTPKVSNLIRAVSRGDTRKIFNFLMCGLSPNITNGDGDTLLFIAMEKENLSIIKQLLDHPKTDANITNSEGKTPLVLAVEKQNLELVKCLVKGKVDVNVPDSNGQTALHAALQSRELLQFLIENGADVNIPDKNGDTALHSAVLQDDMETLCMLLYYNADANAPDANGIVPYEKASLTEPNGWKYEEVLSEYTLDDSLQYLEFQQSILLTMGINPLSKFSLDRVRTGLNSFQNFMSPNRSAHLRAFKIAWDNLPRLPDVDYLAWTLYKLFKFDKNIVESYINIIVESLETFHVRKISFINTFNHTLKDFYYKQVDVNLLTKLVCRMLECGWIPCLEDIYYFLYFYEDSEIFKMLPYFQYEGYFDYLPSFDPVCCVLRFIFDIHTSIKDMKQKLVASSNGVYIADQTDCRIFLRHCANRRLMTMYRYKFAEDDLPTVPKLTELARDATRDYIIHKFGITTTWQYHTTVDQLSVPINVKEILKFQKILYDLPVNMNEKREDGPETFLSLIYKRNGHLTKFRRN